MLTDEQIAYLLELRDAKPRLPESTVRVMLRALRWSEEEILKGIGFLNWPGQDAQAPQREAAAPFPVLSPISAALPAPAIKPAVSISVKQNPFPVRAPLIHGDKKSRPEKRGFWTGRLGVIHGALFGFVFFIVGLLAYVYLFNF